MAIVLTRLNDAQLAQLDAAGIPYRTFPTELVQEFLEAAANLGLPPEDVIVKAMKLVLRQRRHDALRQLKEREMADLARQIDADLGL